MPVRPAYRWNLGSFAREHRMRDYDWFWRVEPGVSALSSPKDAVFVALVLLPRCSP